MCIKEAKKSIYNQMRLYISGGKHIHRNTTERENATFTALNGQPDVIFEEASEDSSNNSGNWAAILTAPLIVVSLNFYILFLRLFSIPFGSDSELKSRLYDGEAVDRIKVDRSLLPFISEARKLWILSNWVSILISLTLAVFDIYVGLFFIVVFATVITLSFIAATVAPRNYAIALNLMKAAQQNEYESGVLIVGEEHREEIKSHIESASNEIEIIDDPEPELDSK